MSIRVHPWLKRALWGLPLAWLWFRLIDHLRLEWAVNPQYAYGWAVPFLCAYLLWRNAEMLKAEMLKSSEGQAESRKQKAEEGPRDYETTRPRTTDYGTTDYKTTDHGPRTTDYASRTTPHASPFSFSAFQLFSVSLLAFLYLPTRLIQEANPEWRLVSWALALEVIGITLLLLRSTEDGGRGTEDGARFTLHASRFTFPLLFFLVAVPWPTFIEGPLVQGLMRANVGVTTELLGAFGVPAVPHGNVIEIATGTVGVDDACSGIRSFQATLMISLFFGELYGLTAMRRVLCVFAGFGLSFLFNVARTTLLTWVAAHKGAAAIASWHDPAGITILVACFLCLWLIARGLGGKAETLKAEMLKSETLRSPGPFSVSAFQRFSILLAAWLLTVEAGTGLWYRSHEWMVPMATAWHVEFPRDNATFRELPLSDKTRQFLRYDAGENGTWQEGADQRWQAIFFRWNPGRIAVHLAKSHTPEVCLTAAGRELLSQAGIRAIPVHGLQLPFRSYVVKDERGPLHVFYCLWEDRANAQSFRTTMMTYGNRLAPVLAGRRNSGQRSLEVAIWGIADEGEAEAALGRELDKLIKLEKPQRDQETTDHRPRTTDHGPLLVSDFSFSAFQLFSIFF